MSLRYALAILATGLGLFTTKVAAQQPAPPEATVHRLRNAAAADVAKALTNFATQKKLAVSIVAEPISNTVFVAGEPAPHKKVVELLTEIDTPPTMFIIQTLILEVPAGFAEDVGLGEGDTWVLTPREVRMLTAAVRREKKEGNLDILSRPQLTVANNQTGFIKVGSDTAGITSRITPRITPDGGSVMLRFEIQCTKAVGAGASEAQSIQTATIVPNGGTLVARGARSKTSDGGMREVFVLMTVQRVTPQSNP